MQPLRKLIGQLPTGRRRGIPGLGTRIMVCAITQKIVPIRQRDQLFKEILAGDGALRIGGRTQIGNRRTVQNRRIQIRVTRHMAGIRRRGDKDRLGAHGGGGGPIADILATYGMHVIDSGVAVLSMHALWEVANKADIYEAYRGYKAFLERA